MGAEPTVLLGYVVQEGDLDGDGISIEANRLSLNGGTIWDKIGNHADLTHKAVNADLGHKVEALDITGPDQSTQCRRDQQSGWRPTNTASETKSKLWSPSVKNVYRHR